MNIKKLIKNDSQFLSLTSLYVSEFKELLQPFSHRWRTHIKHFTLRGKRRRKPLTFRQLASATTKLKSPEEKLFFILYFFKNNHLQQALAAQFDMNQSQVSRWIKVLLPILEQSIKDLHVQTARTMDELVRLFRRRQHKATQDNDQEPTESLHLDATERTMQRNVDDQAQAEDFSGKQGAHTLKNSILSDEHQFIHFLGYTFRGAVHDKTMAEQELPNLTPLQLYNLWLSKDKAYQAYLVAGVHLLEPFKAKRNNPLTDFQKEFNQWISSIRITCEHAIAGVKRCRLLKETLRYFDATFRDKIMAVGCGLHNFRVTRRKDSYARGAQRVRARINLNLSPT